jgi:hypothetical protein
MSGSEGIIHACLRPKCRENLRHEVATAIDDYLRLVARVTCHGTRLPRARFI